MPERIATRNVQFTTSGSFFVGLPKDYATDLGIGKDTVMEVRRRGDTLIYRPLLDKEAKSK